jgi:5-methylcytosine-specific restriction endonuclease McrA
MAHKRPSLIKTRNIAFRSQQGRCFYCELPMWVEDISCFCMLNKISEQKARHFQCTGEHIVAFSDGGTADISNIVACCKFCNHKRHARKNLLEPKDYKKLVLKRLRKGKWNLPLLKSNRNISIST